MRLQFLKFMFLLGIKSMWYHEFVSKKIVSKTIWVFCLCLVYLIFDMLKLSFSFRFSTENISDLKEFKSLLLSFEVKLRHLNSLKVSQNEKFCRSFFQLKIKRKQRFQVRRQFKHFEYDINWTLQ